MNESPLPRPEATLEDCDREPIHIPGSIQPHGALLAIDREERVVARSANLAEYLGSPGGDKLSDWFGDADLRELRRALGGELTPSAVPSLQLAGLDGLDVIVHLNQQGLHMLEFERYERGLAELQDVHRQSREAIGTLSGARSLDELYTQLVESVRRISGFERVMLYRFEHDDSGVVVAESLAQGVDGYLGHHFPASDIPKQARRLYELNLLRLIPDASTEQVALLGTLPMEEALDLSFSVLRSVSPIHLRYLVNMDVAASMSISLLSGGRLWGLIACHHSKPRAVPFEVRQVCELLGQVAALRIDLQQEQEERIAVQELRSRSEKIVQRVLEHKSIEEGLELEAHNLHPLFDAEGFVLRVEDDEPSVLGALPAGFDLRQFQERLSAVSGDDLWASHHLAGEPGFEDASLEDFPAGVLRLRIARQLELAWLRSEVVDTVTWAGNPDKPVVPGPDGADRLQPRESFEAWRVERRGHSSPWSSADMAAAAWLRQQLIETSLRLAEERRTEAVLALNEELEASNADLDRFVSIAAHDLQAPVRAIERLADWIREDEGERLEGSSREHLDLLTQRSQRLATMLRDLVQFSRAGRMSYDWEDFDLVDLWRILEEEVDLPEGFEVLVNSELRQLHAPRAPFEIILRNLLANAAKHHDRSDGRIELRAAKIPEGIELRVIDDGPGIPPEQRDMAFELFRTLKSRDEREGSGMGLALMRRLLEGYGARIEIDGRAGRGAEFVITWPYLPSGKRVS
jgi:chemotaxis family two-component system sensor kinase Cph1